METEKNTTSSDLETTNTTTTTPLTPTTINATTGETVDTSSTDNTDYFELLRDENYKAFLSKEMQLDNARQRALKATNNTFASMGMASSGYASTAQGGIEGEYLAGLESAQQGYQEGEASIKQQEIAQQETNFNNMASVISNASDTTSMVSALQSYGITYDPNTKTFSGEGYDKLTDTQKTDLAAAINLKQYGLEQQALESQLQQQGVADITQNKNIVYWENGQMVTGNRLKSERTALVNAMMTGDIKSGTVCKLEHSNGDLVTYVYVYNGQTYYATEEQYNKAITSGNAKFIKNGKISDGSF